MEDCIFCKIIKGKIPNYNVYEDEDYMAFLSIQPLNPGHVLVIPKKHYRWVWDVTEIGAYYEIVGKVAKGIQKGLDVEYVVSLVFGEEVPHAHVWLVPRFEDDGHGGSIDMKNFKEVSTEEMVEVAEKIREAIR